MLNSTCLCQYKLYNRLSQKILEQAESWTHYFITQLLFWISRWILKAMRLVIFKLTINYTESRKMHIHVPRVLMHLKLTGSMFLTKPEMHRVLQVWGTYPMSRIVIQHLRLILVFVGRVVLVIIQILIRGLWKVLRFRDGLLNWLEFP